MTPEQFVAILTAFAAVLGAVAVCIGEVRRYHTAVNSKMDALLSLTAAASKAEGKEAERQEQAVALAAESRLRRFGDSGESGP